MKSCLVINPGSTSTKAGVFMGTEALIVKTVRHSQTELNGFPTISAQRRYRTEAVEGILREGNIDLAQIGVAVAIGGLIYPGKAGVYRVNAAMLRDLREARYDEHASNLGALIADDFAHRLNISAYAADAITADEMEDVARLSGIPEIIRLGRSHTLNQKYMARKAANALGKQYKDAALIVVHLGGGISVTAHRNGQMVDTNAARGEGPFCIDRSGGVNSFELAKLCFSGRYSKQEMLKKINGDGGVAAYLGTRDFQEVEARMNNGDGIALAVFQSMAYQVAKEIAAMTIALRRPADAIVLTGGMAHSKAFCARISEQVAFLGKVMVFPGEGEMEALAEYGRAILKGDLIPMEYEGE